MTPAQRAVSASRDHLLLSWGAMEDAIANLESDRDTAVTAVSFHHSGEIAAQTWLLEINGAMSTIHVAQRKLEELMGD